MLIKYWNKPCHFGHPECNNLSYKIGIFSRPQAPAFLVPKPRLFSFPSPSLGTHLPGKPRLPVAGDGPKPGLGNEEKNDLQSRFTVKRFSKSFFKVRSAEMKKNDLQSRFTKSGVLK